MEGGSSSEESSSILLQGWLIKSPPLERATHTIFKARWRRRWFVLELGKFPAQYNLHYFVDETRKKLKGTISLDECEGVDSGLTIENGKSKYEYMFDIRTPNRVYYLAADSFDEMTAWVQAVCSVCGLRPTQEQDENGAYSPAISTAASTLPPSTEVPVISSPYIHISTCYSGGKPTVQRQHSRSLASLTAPPAAPNGPRAPSGDPRPRGPSGDSRHNLELSNYDLGDDSVFTNETSPGMRTVPRSHSVSQPRSTSGDFAAPSRPPKPSHLATQTVSLHATTNGENYENSLDMQKVFQQDSEHNNNYSVPAPPRDLKPDRRKDSASENNTYLNTTLGPPPPVPRQLKPKNTPALSTSSSTGDSSYPSSTLPSTNHPSSFPSSTLPLLGSRVSAPLPQRTGRYSSSDDGSLSDAESTRNSAQEEQIYYYMPSIQNADGTNLMIPAESFEHPSIAYIDLDLPPPSDDIKTINRQDRTESSNIPSSNVYTTLDFIKTEAVNRTRQNVENKYNADAQQE